MKEDVAFDPVNAAFTPQIIHLMAGNL